MHSQIEAGTVTLRSGGLNSSSYAALSRSFRTCTMLR